MAACTRVQLLTAPGNGDGHALASLQGMFAVLSVYIEGHHILIRHGDGRARLERHAAVVARGEGDDGRLLLQGGAAQLQRVLWRALRQLHTTKSPIIAAKRLPVMAMKPPSLLPPHRVPQS